MTQRTLGGIGVAVAGLVGLLMAVQPASAVVQFPTKALNYTTWLARAMDQCSPATVSVVTGQNLPSAGCYQSNTVTDGSVIPGATMGFARLSVQRTANHSGRITVFGSGFHGGQRMKVQLKLRVTEPRVSTKHPPEITRVTFQDVTVACGNNNLTQCFTANLNGKVAGSMSLKDCLLQDSQPTGLGIGNIQILDSALLNCDTGKIIATPGILQ